MKDKIDSWHKRLGEICGHLCIALVQSKLHGGRGFLLASASTLRQIADEMEAIANGKEKPSGE